MNIDKLTRANWEEILGADYGIVGTGGGYKGALSMGMMMALYQKVLSTGFWPKTMWAVSVNTLNFADIISSSNITGAWSTWQRIERRGPNILFNKWSAYWNAFLSFFVKRNALFGGAGLEKLVAALNMRLLVDASTELRFAVHRERMNHGLIYEVKSSHEGCFKTGDGLDDLRHLVKASASFAGFLPPEIVWGHTWSDGLRPPLMEAVRRGCKTIFLLINDVYLPKNHAKASWLERAFYTQDANYDAIIKKDIGAAIDNFGYNIVNAVSSLPVIAVVRKLEEERARLEADGTLPERPRERVIVLVAARKPIPDLSTRSFAHGSISFAIEHGKECMREALSALVEFRSQLLPNEPSPL